MIGIEITSKSQDIVFTNILPKYKEKFESNKSSKENGVRSIFKEDKDGVGLWMITDDQDIYKSAKIANKSFNFFLEVFTGIHEHYEIVTLSNTHTIATIQAKMSQQIETLVGSQRGNYQRIMDDVKGKIERDTQAASKIICDLNKRVEELDTHLKSLQILDDKTAVDLKIHPLKSMLLNIYSPFRDDFRNKSIKVVFDRIDENLKIKVDYKIFSLVMHHFFDNAVKYSKDEDEISFVYSQNNNLVINMHSIEIKTEDNIFDIGVSGKNADAFAGNGIGMHVIKKGLKIMGMDIEIKNSGILDNHPKFNKNHFIITLVPTL